MNTTEARLVHNVEGSVSAQDMRERIRNGLLDVRSLYVNEEGKKNQYYQGYLHKFQADGMTIDDIRFVDETISSHEVDIRREQRVPELLLLFGKMLDFESERINEGDNKVVWKAKEGVSVSFRVTNKGISVSASQRMLEGVPVSEVGIIRDRELESALYKWCLRNPDKSRNLMNRLIPMAKSSKPQASPEHRLLRVLSNDKLCPDHYMITLAIPSTTASEPRPGQFFHVVCDPDGEKTITNDGEVRGYALTLRRPFSVHRIRYANFDRRLLATPTIIPYEIKEIIRRPIREVDILYKVVGKGTKDLSRVAPGNHLDVIGPLGNGFNTEKVDTAVIVAGGIGVAPLVALAERLRYSGSKVFPYFGALKKELFRPILGRTDSTVEITFRNGEPEFLQHINHVFREIGAEEVKICTDDGSLGERARVPDLLRRDIESGFLPSSKLAIFACGPLDMIRAVCKIANKHKIPGQVLLEERMACGIGACFSCTCRVQRKNGTVEKVRVCKDGPVFKAEEIL